MHPQPMFTAHTRDSEKLSILGCFTLGFMRIDLSRYLAVGFNRPPLCFGDKNQRKPPEKGEFDKQQDVYMCSVLLRP